MLPRFHLSDLTTVGHYLGVLSLLVGALMCVPLLVALLFGEIACAVDFVFAISLCLSVGAALRLLKPLKLDRRCTLLLTGAGWIFAGLLGAVPLYLSGGFDSFVNALFDAVSALTTTGATLAADIDHMAYSLVTWRAVLTLAGAQAVVFITLYFGFAGEGGYTTRSNSRGVSDVLTLNFRSFGGALWVVLAGVVVVGTAVAFGIGLYLGMKPADAVLNGFWLTASAYSTGGFLPYSSSIVFYHSLGIEAFAIVFMFLGSLNFALLVLALRGQGRVARKNTELRTYLVWLVVLVAVVTAMLTRDGIYETVGSVLHNGTFMALASAMTGGMQTVYPEQLGRTFSDSALILIMAATLVGASSCSPTGGVKVFRVMEVLRWVGYTIRRALLPDSARISVRYNHFGVKQMDSSDAMRAMTICILYIVTAALGAMAFIAHGNAALDSVFESLSYVCNNGMTSGISSPDMGLDLRIIALFMMWCGRVEFIALVSAVVGLVVSVRPSMTGSRRAPRRGRGQATTWQQLQANRARAKRRGRRIEAKRVPGSDNDQQRSSIRVDAPSRRGGRGGGDGSSHVGSVAVVVLLAAALAACPLAGTAQARTDAGAADELEEVAESAADAAIVAPSGYREMTVADLVRSTARLDGKGVDVTGEVVGDPLRADAEHVWLNVRDGRHMVGVYVHVDAVADIEHFGSYRCSGDTVQVRGEYHLSCARHAGQLDVHATSIQVVAAGTQAEHPHSWPRVLWSLAFFAVFAALVFTRRVLTGRSRLSEYIDV